MDKYIAAKVGIHGTKATVLESNSITVGLTGAVVQLIYDDDLWQGMRKKVTFRGLCKIDVLTDENEVQLPWEVTTAKNVPVCVGVTGVDAAEKVLIPTVWATIGTVLDSAAGHNPAPGEPVPPVWAQVFSIIGELEKLDTENRENLVAAINEVLSKVGTGGGNVDLSGYATKEWVKRYVEDSGGNANQSGLTQTEKNLILTLFRNATYTSNDMGAVLAQLESMWSGGNVEPDNPDNPDVPVDPDEPEKTLTSISAVYSGGSVTAGTAVNTLTGIVVTAHYSDGTSETVTGYTLSGTIVDGSNTITVSYGGKTTTFAVTGVVAEVTSLRGIQLPFVPTNFISNENWQYAGNSGNLNSVIGVNYLYLKRVFTGTVWIRSMTGSPFTGISMGMALVAEDYITNQTADGEKMTATQTWNKFDDGYLRVSEDGSEYKFSSDYPSDGLRYVRLSRFDIPEGQYAILYAASAGTGNGDTFNIDGGWMTVFFEDPIDHIAVTEVYE